MKWVENVPKIFVGVSNRRRAEHDCKPSVNRHGVTVYYASDTSVSFSTNTSGTTYMSSGGHQGIRALRMLGNFERRFNPSDKRLLYLMAVLLVLLQKKKEVTHRDTVTRTTCHNRHQFPMKRCALGSGQGPVLRYVQQNNAFFSLLPLRVL
jgi:hypothetical protein